jgi:hypothetical protein
MLRDNGKGKGKGKGKTFAEVGGLWGTSNEQVTTAGLGGARELATIDIAPAETDLWTLFKQRCTDMGVSGVAEINGSIDDRATVERAGSFDVVCCNGPVPALSRSQQAVVGQWLRELGDVNIQADGITNGVDWDLHDYSPWWWLFTRDHVAALLEIAGFEVEAVAGYWEGRATYFRARAI